MKEAQNTRRDFDLVMAMHPQQAAVVRRLLLKSAEFREMCDDYLLVRKMITELEGKASPDIAHSREEYTQLAADLEREIARALKSACTDSAL